MNLKISIYFIIFVFGIIGGISVSSAFLLPDETLPLNLPDGRLVSEIPDFSTFNDTQLYPMQDLYAWLGNANLSRNFLYWRIITPNYANNQWNLSGSEGEAFESKPYALLKAIYESDGTVRIKPVTQRGLSYAWVCCNVSVNDRLYTADASSNSSLLGTLTNMQNLNYRSRYPYDNGSYRNPFVGASQIPNVYNRRAALSQDGTQIAYAMETRNVSVAGVPELMKVFLI